MSTYRESLWNLKTMGEMEKQNHHLADNESHRFKVNHLGKGFF